MSSFNGNHNDQENTDFIYKFNKFENKHRAIINLILKPLVTTLVILCVGYYTLWLQSNYVQRDQFEAYVSKQDVFIISQFDNSNAKLNTLINQQSVFAEQFKSYNLLLSNIQRQIDGVSDRVIYLERVNKNSNP